jgi:hypothetical protein
MESGGMPSPKRRKCGESESVRLSSSGTELEHVSQQREMAPLLNDLSVKTAHPDSVLALALSSEWDKFQNLLSQTEMRAKLSEQLDEESVALIFSKAFAEDQWQYLVPLFGFLTSQQRERMIRKSLECRDALVLRRLIALGLTDAERYTLSSALGELIKCCENCDSCKTVVDKLRKIKQTTSFQKHNGCETSMEEVSDDDNADKAIEDADNDNSDKAIENGGKEEYVRGGLCKFHRENKDKRDDWSSRNCFYSQFKKPNSDGSCICIDGFITTCSHLCVSCFHFVLNSLYHSKDLKLISTAIGPAAAQWMRVCVGLKSPLSFLVCGHLVTGMGEWISRMYLAQAVCHGDWILALSWLQSGWEPGDWALAMLLESPAAKLILDEFANFRSGIRRRVLAAALKTDLYNIVPELVRQLTEEEIAGNILQAAETRDADLFLHYFAPGLDKCRRVFKLYFYGGVRQKLSRAESKSVIGNMLDHSRKTRKRRHDGPDRMKYLMQKHSVWMYNTFCSTDHTLDLARYVATECDLLEYIGEKRRRMETVTSDPGEGTHAGPTVAEKRELQRVERDTKRTLVSEPVSGLRYNHRWQFMTDQERERERRRNSNNFEWKHVDLVVDFVQNYPQLFDLRNDECRLAVRKLLETDRDHVSKLEVLLDGLNGPVSKIKIISYIVYNSFLFWSVQSLQA